MFPRVLSRMRENVRMRFYVMTVHAEEEMGSDSLTIYDVERAILTGQIVERQKDRRTDEWKYRIRGATIDGTSIEVVGKIGPTGKLVIITVYGV